MDTTDGWRARRKGVSAADVAVNPQVSIAPFESAVFEDATCFRPWRFDQSLVLDLDELTAKKILQLEVWGKQSSKGYAWAIEFNSGTATASNP